MSLAWTDLRQALTRLRRSGTSLSLWWRDDDATQQTPQLDRLQALAQKTGLPVHLAIIPAKLDTALPSALDPKHSLPLIHGWQHRDHAREGEKKNEFLTERPKRSDETALALARINTVFENAALPVFVPPWNRIAPQVIEKLPEQGYKAISTYGPRRAKYAAPGLLQINTHLDPIEWHGSRDLIDTETLLSNAVAQIEQRLTATVDAREPFGYLTHHLIHSEKIWAFSDRFISEMLDAGAEPWTMKDIG